MSGGGSLVAGLDAVSQRLYGSQLTRRPYLTLLVFFAGLFLDSPGVSTISSVLDDSETALGDARGQPNWVQRPDTELPPVMWNRASLPLLHWSARAGISYEGVMGTLQWRPNCARDLSRPLSCRRLWPAPTLLSHISGRPEVLTCMDRFIRLPG